MSARCASKGRGVIGREVKSCGYPRSLVVTAVRCVAGVHSYRLRDPELRRAVSYNYCVPLKPVPIPKGALFTYAMMRGAVERAINPLFVSKRSPWHPASVVKFVRRSYVPKIPPDEGK